MRELFKISMMLEGPGIKLKKLPKLKLPKVLVDELAVIAKKVSTLVQHYIDVEIVNNPEPKETKDE